MRTLIVALIFFLLGFAAFWSYNKYQVLITENDRLKKEITKIPSNTADSTPTSQPAIDEAEQEGSITGSLGYPSEMIPAMEIFAYNVDDPQTYFKIETDENQGTYEITGVKPGKYTVVAYLKSDSKSSGGYTKAVPCGLSVICTDHSLIEIEVKSGQKKEGVDLKDWYAPENSFPSKPQ